MRPLIPLVASIAMLCGASAQSSSLCSSVPAGSYCDVNAVPVSIQSCPVGGTSTPYTLSLDNTKCYSNSNPILKTTSVRCDRINQVTRTTTSSLVQIGEYVNSKGGCATCLAGTSTSFKSLTQNPKLCYTQVDLNRMEIPATTTTTTTRQPATTTTTRQPVTTTKPARMLRVENNLRGEVVPIGVGCYAPSPFDFQDVIKADIRANVFLSQDYHTLVIEEPSDYLNSRIKPYTCEFYEIAFDPSLISSYDGTAEKGVFDISSANCISLTNQILPYFYPINPSDGVSDGVSIDGYLYAV